MVQKVAHQNQRVLSDIVSTNYLSDQSGLLIINSYAVDGYLMKPICYTLLQ